MATAEVGALRVSLSLDSAAFTAGARAATASAATAATSITASFQGASTRVTASMAAMGGALQTQLRAGFLQQVGALRTGLLGLISPVGLLVGGAAALLPQLINRENEAADAARVHADMLSRLNDEVGDARNKSPDYIQARQNEAIADLDAAQAAVQMGRARLEAYRAQYRALADQAAQMNPVQLSIQAALGVGVGGQIQDAIPEWQEINRQIAESEDLVAALNTQLVQLRGQQFRSAAILRNGGTLPGTPPETTTPDRAAQGAARAAEAEADRIHSAQLAKLKDFEDEQTAVVRAAEEQRRALREAAISSVASIFGSLATIVGDGSERAFKLAKKFSLAEAAINIATGITKALSGPFPFINAARVAVAGAAQIATILRTQPGSASVTTPVAGGGASEGGGSSGASASDGGRAVNITLVGGDSYSRKSVRDLMERIKVEMRDGATLTVT